MKNRFKAASLAVVVITFLAFLLTAGSKPVHALQPPSPGEIEKYKADGTYAERLDRVLKHGNHKLKTDVLEEANRNIKRLYMKARGQAYDQRVVHEIPPSWKSSFPSVGNPQLLVFLVDFPDYPHAEDQTVQEVESKMFGAGDPSLYPYENLSAYHRRSSYGKLNITGEVLGWYRAAHERSYYEEFEDEGMDILIKEIFQHYEAGGYDFSKYDNNSDGVIDGFYIKWTGPDSGWGGFWWAVQSNFTDNSFSVSGKKLNYYCFSWYSNEEQDELAGYAPRTDIHEMGHLLGLPDYYDYDEDIGPNGGIGGLDIMDSSYGDHNCFSKFVLGWLEPDIVATGAKNINLQPSGSSPDAVLIMPDAKSTPFGYEFFMAQYRKRSAGNDPGSNVMATYKPYPADGLIIWHVDTTTGSDGETLYNNSDTEHKLLRLMEADGLEDIEQGSGEGDAGDFYLPPNWFGPDTSPNSFDYKNRDTGIIINQLTDPGEDMGAVFSIGSQEVPFLPGYEDWGAKDTQDLRKTWSIRFNKPVDATGVNEYIFITDANNQKINTTVTVDSDTVTITPESDYNVDQQYRLYICQSIRSTEGICLKKAIVMPFSCVRV